MHYYSKGDDHKDASNPPPSQKELFDSFVASDFLWLANGSVQPSCTKYYKTEKLQVFCDALCSVNEPVSEWVIKC